MALTPGSFLLSLNNARFAGPFQMDGPAFSLLAQGISQGLSTWAVGNSTNLALQGTAVGTAGTGTIIPPTSRLFLLPLSTFLITALTGAGIAGPVSTSLALVVTQAVSETFSTVGQYVGTSALVGVGQDISSVVVANPVTLAAILQSTLIGAGVAGPTSGSLSTGLAQGVTSLLLTMTGTGTIVGTPSAVAATGVTNSFVV